MAKRATIKSVQAKIKALCDKNLEQCHLDWEIHWGERTYWLIFTSPDVREKVKFKRIQDVADWLEYFEEKQG